MSSDQLRRILFNLVRLKFSSHEVFRSLIPRIAQNITQTLPNDLLYLIKDLLLITKSYILSNQTTIEESIKQNIVIEERLLAEILSHISVNQMLLRWKELFIDPFDEPNLTP